VEKKTRPRLSHPAVQVTTTHRIFTRSFSTAQAPNTEILSIFSVTFSRVSSSFNAGRSVSSITRAVFRQRAVARFLHGGE